MAKFPSTGAGIEVSSPALAPTPGTDPLMSALSTLAWYYAHDLDAQVAPSSLAPLTASRD